MMSFLVTDTYGLTGPGFSSVADRRRTRGVYNRSQVADLSTTLFDSNNTKVTNHGEVFRGMRARTHELG